MKNVILIMMFLFLFHGFASAGPLTGRIIKFDGSSLANTTIIIGRDTVITPADTTITPITITTNVFGGYSMTIPDGRHKIIMEIDTAIYESDTLIIYSPRTKQNWRLGEIGESGEGILIRIQ